MLGKNLTHHTYKIFKYILALLISEKKDRINERQYLQCHVVQQLSLRNILFFINTRKKIL